MVTLSCAVMAHPARAAFVEELLGQLDRPVPVVWDTEGPASADLEKQWRNARRTWEAHDPAADWHLLIQDDALVVPDLLAGLEKALDHVPDQVIVQPYVGTKQPNVALVDAKVAAAEEVGASWIRMGSLMWGVATAVPVAEIPAMVEWCSRRERRGWADDKRVGRYFRDHRRWPVFYPWPCLVDHRQGPSICGHDGGGRRARRMWDRSALEHDWTGPVVTHARPMNGRNLMKHVRVRMTHPRSPGARLIPEHDVARWERRGWRVDPDTGPVVPQKADPDPEPEPEPAPEPEAEVADSVEPDPVLVGDEETETVQPDPAAVRAWAAEQGHTVSTRGKLPQRLIAAYSEAHPA